MMVRNTDSRVDLSGHPASSGAGGDERRRW
jgi:hypothetical protein